MELIHGGDVAGYEMRYGRPPLDFSASLNPLGTPPAVAEAARKAVADAAPYPDPLCRRLSAALADSLGVDAQTVFCGNGAADVIYRFVLARRPRTALIPAPSFAEYEQALRCVECATVFHPLSRADGFRLDESVLEKITDDIDVVFLCQPNNPTGQPVEPEFLAAILQRCEATGTILFLDECFCCFVDEPERHSLMHRIGDSRNLFILGSFTKLYAMAGLRLGYGVCGDAGLMARLYAMGQPWTVSNVAQAAGLAALGETEYVNGSLRLLRREKERFASILTALGLEIIGSGANYLFFHSDIPDLFPRLADAGILIRDCSNFRGLGPGYFRVAVRKREDNDCLVAALRTLMDQ